MSLLSFARATTVAAMAAVLALGSVATAGAQSEAGSELHFLNYDEYVDPQVLEDFEAEFGIKVIIDTFDDENEMVSIIQADTSRYDLFSTSGTTLFEMNEQRLLADLDLTNIPNLANLDPRYRDLPNDPGNRHSVAYDWGTTGLAYNTDCLQPEEESWNLLMDPRAKGRVGMDSDFSVVLGVALKYLGYPLNSSDPGQVDEAIAYLRELQAKQGMEFMTWDEMLDGLATGDLCVATTFNGDTAVYMDEFENIGFFVPAEGSDFYVDVLAIPRDARNKLGAELFMDYILRPDVHAANNDYTGYAVPNRASVEGGYVDEDVLADPVRYPDAETLEAWVPFTTERRSLWNQAWSDFITTTTP
jgi:spermidine/putrescine transport system substrate-binding protein